MVTSDNREYPETHSVTGGQCPPSPGVAEEREDVWSKLPSAEDMEREWCELMAAEELEDVWSKLPSAEDVAEELSKLPSDMAEEWTELLNTLTGRPQDKRGKLMQKLPAIAEGPSGLRIYNPEQ